MDQYLPTLIQAVATTSAIVTAVVFYWRRTLFSPSIFRSSVPNDLVDWIDQGSFEVAAAICDTLLPSHDESVVDQHRLQLFVFNDHECDTKWEKELYSLLLRFAGIENTTFNSSTIPSTTHALQLTQLLQPESRNYLYRGAFIQKQGQGQGQAQGAKIHIEVCNAMRKVLLPEDKQQISIFLKVMSTSVGSLLLVGYPVPFPCLPLTHRITGVDRRVPFHIIPLDVPIYPSMPLIIYACISSLNTAALKRLQTSFLWQMRGAFLAFKRAAGFLFLSTTMRGTTNPNWIALRYDPDSVISKPTPSDRDGVDRVDQEEVGTVEKLSAIAHAVVEGVTKDNGGSSEKGGNNDRGGRGESPARRLSALALRSLSLQSARTFALPPSPSPCAQDKTSPTSALPPLPPQPSSPQASSPTAPRKFDVIVVGSGSGGGVIASELVNAGNDCQRPALLHTPALSHTRWHTLYQPTVIDALSQLKPSPHPLN